LTTIRYPDFFEQSPWLRPLHADSDEPAGSAEARDTLAPWIGVAARPDDAPAVPILPAFEVGWRPQPVELPDDVPRGRFTVESSPGLDAVASYQPYHFAFEGWGIRVYEKPFLGFAADLADLLGEPIERIVPLAFRQVLFHEWTHFAFEIVGTTLDSVLAGIDGLVSVCYRDYCESRYANGSQWSDGPLEEAVAVWAELQFARRQLPERLRPKPRRYAEAVAALGRASPAGYRDFQCMRGRNAERVLAHLAGTIADAEICTGRWGETTAAERAQVPVYWIGDPTLLPSVGAVPKTVAAPSINRFERWLKKRHKASIETRRGKGSHRRFVLPDGQSGGYATSAGFLLGPEANEAARILGLPNARALYEAVARGVRETGSGA